MLLELSLVFQLLLGSCSTQFSPCCPPSSQYLKIQHKHNNTPLCGQPEPFFPLLLQLCVLLFGKPPATYGKHCPLSGAATALPWTQHLPTPRVGDFPKSIPRTLAKQSAFTILLSAGILRSALPMRSLYSSDKMHITSI